MSQKQTQTFMQATADFFGRKQGQTLMEFRNELKALTDADRAEIREGLQQLGYNISGEGPAVTNVGKAVADMGAVPA